MNHLEVLREVASRGLSITADGADLRLQGPRERMDPDLVGRIRACKPALLSHLAAEAAQAGGFGLTPLQRSYLLGRDGIFEIGNVASYIYHEIEGAWDVDRLESALQAVVARHGMLRTHFTAEGRQVQQPAAGVRIGRLDLRGEPETAQEQRRRALREERSHRILPADRAPLLAVDVTILAEDRMVLHVGHDGLVIDGISMFLLFRDWWSSYGGAPPEAVEEAPFEAYLAALETARTRAPAQRSRAHWLDRLDDLAPHPDLPLATSPSAITDPRFSQRVVRLDERAWTAVRARAAEHGLTASCVLLAAYAETLARWGAGERFTINTTVANRPPIHPRIFDAVGQFSDTMLVEIDVDRSVGFRDRARALQARLRSGLDHRHFSGIEVIRELGRRRGGPSQARMPFTFNSAIDYVRGDVDGSALELFGPEVYSVSQTPQVWLNVFAMEQHGGVVLQLDGVDELFCDGLLDAIAGAYQTLLDELVDEPAWSATTFDLLPEAQKARRRAANDTAAPVPETLLHEAFVAQARHAPDAPALLTSRGAMSYGELHRRAARAAGWLRDRQVGRDELVGLVMTRGPEQVVGILASVMAGGAYLPVDATLPAQRQRYMLRDGRVRCVLTNTDRGAEAGEGISVLALDTSAPVDAGDPPAPGHARAPAGASPDDLAYVLYTSGTTGEPKGVMVSHRSVANVVADCNARFRVGPADRFFAISAFNFDLSVYDVFGALSAGAAIVLPDADRAADPSAWLQQCAGAGVTVWNSVPAIVALLHDQAVADGAGALASLRLVMMSGDRIPPRLPAALRRLKGDLRVVSLGGPTETTIWNILYETGPDDDGSESIPYGRPNANNRAYVLDRDGQDAPDWVTGEICAAGVGLARGYWGDEERTAERFFHDARRGERLYRTGDLGRYLPDGNIAILGRSDFQIKVNGYRIEAGEVETRLVALDAVRQAVVVRQEGARGDRLVAHLVSAGAERPGDAELQQALRTHLPEYMIPAAIVWHERLPLTRNGKVDRAELVAAVPGQTSPAAQTGAERAPASDCERTIAGLWSDVLGVADVDAVSTLADLGGDSIAAARILTGVRKEFGVTIPLERLPDVNTVRAMAARVEAGRGGSNGRGGAGDSSSPKGGSRPRASDSSSPKGGSRPSMTDSVINHIAAFPPAPGHRISFASLGALESLDSEEAYLRAGRLALHLRARGIGPGDRIGILAANSLEWVLLDLAALRLGAVTAGFELGKTDPDPALLERYDLAVLFTDRPHEPGAGIEPIADVRRLAEPPSPAGALQPVRYTPQDVTTIKFTSGSTGEPKGLAATAGSIDSSLRAVQELFAHGPGDDLFVFLPLSLLQQRYWVYSALCYGHDVTISTYEAAFAALRQAQPTVVMGVPAFFESARRHIEAQAARAGPGTAADAALRVEARRLFGERIRYLWTGSAPASVTTLRFFTALGLPIYEGYGCNETCIVSKNHPGAHREGSVGRVLPGKQVLVGDDGVISVRSDHPVNVRYAYAAPGESERVFGPGGVVRTGDVGYVDADGFLYIQGRADDMIVLANGRNVMPRPVEEHMKASPAIEECAVYCPDRTQLVAVVSPAGDPPDEAAIAAQLAVTNRAFGPDEQIRRVVVARPRFAIDNGMLTAQFKPQRKRIYDAYASQIHDVHGGIDAR